MPPEARWDYLDSVRANLRHYGYPPDLKESATQTVLAQPELLAKDWAG